MFDWRLWRWGWVELSMTSFSVNVRVCVIIGFFWLATPKGGERSVRDIYARVGSVKGVVCVAVRE